VLPRLIKAASGGVYSTEVPYLGDARDPHHQPARAPVSRAAAIVERELRAGQQLRALSPIVQQLRVVKSPAEIACLADAGRASGRVFSAAMKRRWRDEASLWAFLDAGFRRLGCAREAYVPVVAGGR